MVKRAVGQSVGRASLEEVDGVRALRGKKIRYAKTIMKTRTIACERQKTEKINIVHFHFFECVFGAPTFHLFVSPQASPRYSRTTATVWLQPYSRTRNPRCSLQAPSDLYLDIAALYN